MIVRILSEGQFEVPEAEVESLNALDAAVHAAISSDDEVAFSRTLQDLIDVVRRVGGPISDEDIMSSDAILPPADATIDEAKALLHDDGFVPG